MNLYYLDVNIIFFSWLVRDILTKTEYTFFFYRIGKFHSKLTKKSFVGNILNNLGAGSCSNVLI